MTTRRRVGPLWPADPESRISGAGARRQATRAATIRVRAAHCRSRPPIQPAVIPMDKEVDPAVLAVINEKRLTGEKRTPVDIISRMGVFDAREKASDQA